MLKAVFKGWLTSHVLAFIAVLMMFPFWWTLVFVFYRGAMFLDSGVSSSLPWLSILFAAVLLGIGGYVAASNVPRRKVRTGLLLSAVMAAYSVPLAFLAEISRPEEILDRMISIFCIVVFPPIGAFVARKWRRTDRPARPLRKAPVMLAYAAFALGVLLPLAAGLLWCCWMQGSRVADHLDAASGLLTPSIWVAGAGLVLVAYAIIVFVKRRGWKKGIMLNWYVYVVAITACAFCFGFLARDRENRPSLYFTEGPGVDVDSDFVFPDPANPATLYIQASALIPEEDDDSDEEDLLPNPFSLEEQAGLKALLADRSEALTLALRADDQAAICFPQYGVKDIKWRCYYLGRLCETLAARARLAAGAGDVPETLRYLRHIFRISEGLAGSDGDNMIVGCLYRSIAVHVLRDMLRLLDLSEQQLSLIAQELQVWEGDVLPDRERWSIAVRSRPWDTIEELFWSMRRKSPWSFMTSQFVSKGAILVRRSSVVDECLSKPSWSAMFEAFRTENKAHIQYMYEPFYAPALGEAARKIEGLARWDIHDVERRVDRFLSQLTRVRLLRVSAAVLLYRRSKGKLPTVWRDLVGTYLPATLVDPFSEKPLLLKSVGNGLRIYSVGNDGEDGGGSGCFSVEEGERDDSDQFLYSSEWVEDIVIVVPEMPTDASKSPQPPSR